MWLVSEPLCFLNPWSLGFRTKPCCVVLTGGLTSAVDRSEDLSARCLGLQQAWCSVENGWTSDEQKQTSCIPPSVWSSSLEISVRHSPSWDAGHQWWRGWLCSTAGFPVMWKSPFWTEDVILLAVNLLQAHLVCHLRWYMWTYFFRSPHHWRLEFVCFWRDFTYAILVFCSYNLTLLLFCGLVVSRAFLMQYIRKIQQYVNAWIGICG